MLSRRIQFRFPSVRCKKKGCCLYGNILVFKTLQLLVNR